MMRRYQLPLIVAALPAAVLVGIILAPGHGASAAGGRLVAQGVHQSTSITYISGAGTAGTDNTAMTVLSRTLKSNTLVEVGDRIRIRAYWSGDTGNAITGSVKIGPASSEVLVSDTVDVGATTLQINETWLHYIDNTHANVIENESGVLGNRAAPNVAGFAWNTDQSIIFTQSAALANHTILYALIIDVFPKGRYDETPAHHLVAHRRAGVRHFACRGVKTQVCRDVESVGRLMVSARSPGARICRG